MAILQEYAKELFALTVPLATWLLNNWFRARAKLQLAAPHRFTFIVPEPLKDSDGRILQLSQSVHTASYVLMNAGRETATNVELVFNWKPSCINIWPSRHYAEKLEPDHRYVMIFDSLAPNEQVGFELLSINNELPYLLNARSDQCAAKTMEMYPQPIYPTWKKRVAVAIFFLGFASTIYISVVVLQFLVLGTPYGH